MKIDEDKRTATATEFAGDQQNRREFFNGLGKWSMVVVAAVALLRGSVARVHAGRTETPRAGWEPVETGFQRLARKKHRQHVDVPAGHDDTPHADVPHVDYRIQQPGGTGPAGQPPTSIK